MCTLSEADDEKINMPASSAPHDHKLFVDSFSATEITFALSATPFFVCLNQIDGPVGLLDHIVKFS